MKRALAVLAASSLALFGCGNFEANPPSGVWETIEIDLGDLPFDPAELDPDLIFDLINPEDGSLILDRLNEFVPGAIEDELIAHIEELIAAQADFGVSDLSGLLAELDSVLNEVLDLIDLFFGFIPDWLLDPILDLLGVGDLDALLAQLDALLVDAGLLAPHNVDLEELLAAVNGLPGVIDLPVNCTLGSVEFSCAEQIQVLDLTAAIDAVITLTIDVSGAFTGHNDVSVGIVVDATCAGTACEDLLDFSGIGFPFSYALDGQAPALP